MSVSCLPSKAASSVYALSGVDLSDAYRSASSRGGCSGKYRRMTFAHDASSRGSTRSACRTADVTPLSTLHLALCPLGSCN